jgi:hypothetical protein
LQRGARPRAGTGSIPLAPRAPAPGAPGPDASRAAARPPTRPTTATARTVPGRPAAQPSRPSPAAARAIQTASARARSGNTGLNPRQETEGGDADKTKIYVAVGGGVLLLLILLLAFGGGGRSGSRGPSGRFQGRLDDLDRAVKAGQDDRAQQILEGLVDDKDFRRHPRYEECKGWLDQYRAHREQNREAISKIGSFLDRVKAAKANQTALKQAQAFLGECQALIGQYGNLPAAQELIGLRDDLRRWAATESQSSWADEYNSQKDRIAADHLGAGQFGSAIRAWRAFGQRYSQDPLLRSRVDGEIAAINRAAREEAAKLARESAAAADRRPQLEQALSRFDGTDGQDMLRKALEGKTP